MIFNKCLVIGEVYICFKNLKKKYFVEVNKTVFDILYLNLENMYFSSLVKTDGFG